MIKTILFVLLLCIPAAAQTLVNMQKRYGHPVSQTFIIRPEIYVTAISSKAGDVCQLIVSPQLQSETLNYPSTKTMKSDLLTAIIDELVPPEERGKRKLGAFANLTCLPLNNCAGVMDNYERVQIFRNGGTDQERYAIISLNKSSCSQ